MAFDSHCHVHRGQSAADTLRAAFSAGALSGATVYGTEVSDWASLQSLSAAFSPQQLRVGFGVHPWHAHRSCDADGAWLRELRALLSADPRALVGEVGADRAAKAPETGRCEFSAQERAFAQQWALACELRRPISVHCVRFHGAFFEFCRRLSAKHASPSSIAAESVRTLEDCCDVPPAVAMHSFSGSADIALQLTRLRGGVGARFFFGFSAAINLRGESGSAAAAAVLRVVPRSRVLLESDLEDAASAVGDVQRVLSFVADAWGVSAAEAASQTRANAEAFQQMTTTAP